ncbi:carbohydrate ABC transporter permease [Lacrimispora brassicae]
MLKSKVDKKNKKGFGMMPYLFVLPGMLLFFLIAVIPVIQTLCLSFTDWNGVVAFDKINFIGVDNYKTIFSAQEFWIAVKNNLMWALVSVSIPIVIGLLQAAVIVNSDVKFKNLFQLLLFLPQILSSMIMSIMWLAIYDPASGVINAVLGAVGLDSLIRPWLGNKNTAIAALLVMNIWTSYGFNTIIYCTAIRAVDPSMYEAATIDGASPVQSFFGITIPSINKTTTTLLLLSLIGAFKVFDVVFQMTKGGPGYYTYVISYYLYQTAFASNKIGLGCGIAVILTVVVFVISRVFLLLRKED